MHVEQNVTDENGAHNIRFRNGSLQYKEGSEWKDAKQYSMNVDFSTSTSKILNGTIEAPLVLNKATRNLLNPTLQTVTQNGITCTNNGDGTYTLNGTATKDVNLYITESPFENTVVGYKLLGCPINGSKDTYRIVISYYDKNAEWKAEGSDVGNGVIIDGTYPKLNYFIKVASGTTITNIVFKPMLTTDLNVTYDNFVPYSGYDIKSCGKNLLNLVKITFVHAAGVTASVSNGIITLNGTVNTSGGWQDLYFATAEQYISLKKGAKYTISTKDKVQKVFILLRNIKNVPLYSHDCSTNETTFVASQDIVCQVTVTFKESSTFNNTQIVPQIEVGEKATEYEPYQDGGSVRIDSSTEFPLLGLKTFDGETNIISPGNVKVTYAKSESGAAILDASKNKLDKDDIVNNQTTTEEGFALDARQANPNMKGSLGAQIKAINDMLNTKKIPSFAIENIFTGNPFCLVNNSSDVISVQTDWDIDNGGYRVKNIKYPAGTATNLTVSLSLPANSIVIVDVNTLNGENIDIQGSLIRSNFTSSPKIWNLSIIFTGRTNQVLTDIRYMPLVIHLG